MNPDIKAKWIEALRSGEYKQGACYLRQRDEFCCLGVLADIKQVKSTVQIDAHMFHFESESKAAFLPDNYEGLSRVTQSHLAAMNDDGKKFPQIADWIDANL
jgi:hypothetical protein